MTTFHERSAGVIPFHRDGDRGFLYLVLHSATVRNPRAKWEFPKGGVEVGESTRQTAGREFQEETSLTNWSIVDGFERSLSYTYIRRGRKVVKTVTYYLVEVAGPIQPTRSEEHVEDPHGDWYHWGTFEEINRLLYHTKIRQVFAEAQAWLFNASAPQREAEPGATAP
jgi:8-oxo-dGTP pyrophosphatase MutT (NUDIX family)